MPSLRNTLISLAAVSFSTNAYAAHLKVAWSNGGFSTISGPGAGNENGHYSGFAVINDAGEAVYDSDYPDDHAPCYSTGDGREFNLEGGCWKNPRKFKCKSNLAGNPQSCEVLDKDGNSLAKGEGKTDTTFIGIAIGQDSTCVVEFDTDEDEDCPKDSDLHVS